MRINLQRIRNLPAETESGEALGRVVDLELDVDSHEVRCYHIKSKSFVPGLFEQRLIVDRKQVVSLSDERLVVEDAVGRAVQGHSVAEPESV